MSQPARPPFPPDDVPNCRCVVAPLFELKLAANLTEAAASKILHLLRRSERWYDTRRHDVPPALSAAIDEIEIVVLAFDLHKQDARDKAAALAKQHRVDAESERKAHELDEEKRKP